LTISRVSKRDMGTKLLFNNKYLNDDLRENEDPGACLSQDHQIPDCEPLGFIAII